MQIIIVLNSAGLHEGTNAGYHLPVMMIIITNRAVWPNLTESRLWLGLVKSNSTTGSRRKFNLCCIMTGLDEIQSSGQTMMVLIENPRSGYAFKVLASPHTQPLWHLTLTAPHIHMTPSIIRNGLGFTYKSFGSPLPKTRSNSINKIPTYDIQVFWTGLCPIPSQRPNCSVCSFSRLFAAPSQAEPHHRPSLTTPKLQEFLMTIFCYAASSLPSKPQHRLKRPGYLCSVVYQKV